MSDLQHLKRIRFLCSINEQRQLYGVSVLLHGTNQDERIDFTEPIVDVESSTLTPSAIKAVNGILALPGINAVQVYPYSFVIVSRDGVKRADYHDSLVQLLQEVLFQGGAVVQDNSVQAASKAEEPLYIRWSLACAGRPDARSYKVSATFLPEKLCGNTYYVDRRLGEDNLRVFTSDGRRVVLAIHAIPGVISVNVGASEITVVIAEVFDWNECHHGQVIQVLQEQLFPGKTFEPFVNETTGCLVASK